MNKLSNYSNRGLALLGGLLVTLFVLFAPAASADSFSLTDGTNLITFSLPASPTPSFFEPGGSFEQDGISVVVNGVTNTENLFFFSAPSSGGLAISDGTTTLVNQQGGVVYTGTEDAPTFVPGTYPLTNLLLPDNSSAVLTNDFVLTISGSATVPEPSTALLLGFSLLALGGAGLLRKRIQRPINAN
jgi:hypothetical protein